MSFQLDTLKAEGFLKISQEKTIGNKTERLAVSRLLEFIQAADTIIIWRLDRLYMFYARGEKYNKTYLSSLA